MITECRHHKKKFGDLDVVVINNLQEMSIHGYKKITEDRKEIARALKSLAKELDCSIVLISNLDDYDIVSAADVILKSHREDCYRAIKCINKIAKIEIVFLVINDYIYKLKRQTLPWEPINKCALDNIVLDNAAC